MSRIEELEEKLAKTREVREKAEGEQYEKDLEEQIRLVEEHGVIATVKVARFAPGFPTRAFVRTPRSSEYKRYKDSVHRAIDKKNISSQQAASEQLARSCWVYPAPGEGGLSEEQSAMLEKFPGLLTAIGVTAIGLAEGKTVDEGKD